MHERIDREEAIFAAALQLTSPGARSEYLRDACGQDSALRRHIEELLRAHDQAGPFLEKAPAALARPSASASATVKLPTAPAGEGRPVSEQPGDRIGRYKLLQKIGEGGCGVVYMAEQEEPVRRRVAFKIIKVGMDTRQVIARFEAERQALAMMDHPNIARVLDAGATDAGRPFFVMELVRGIRITDYCDQNNLSTRERLELFRQVCHAIQHAHQKGIIHRDIKPSNILVTLHEGTPVPMIIDFGIAKATEQRLTDKTLFTSFEQFIGTPAYMSPEQAEMSRLDIDTRSDIYSLGVLLYELLTGRTPFDPQTLVEAGLDQMRRTIREKEPLRPSTRLSTMLEADLTTVAKHRRSEPLRLIHLLRGDLDWIVMKCLEKDRTRRYETANGLAHDVDRHLRNEPVLARPPSKIYLFQKLVRRNKAAFTAGAAVAVALVLGLAISTYLYFLEKEAYGRALIAERNQSRLRRDAEKAQASEKEQRRIAEENARQFRLNSYAADISSAFVALQSENLGRAMDLLDRQIPRPGEDDLRDFGWRYLWQQAQGDELVSLPHPGLVSCAVFSPDARRLATASYDGLIRIWDVPSRQVVRSMSGFAQQFGWRYLAYSPDGKWLAALHQGKLTVWDASRHEYPVQFEGPIAARVLQFTGDGARVVGWGNSGLVVLDTADWHATVLPTRLKPDSFPALALDKPGNLAAVAHEGEDAIEVWNLEALVPAQYFTFKHRASKAFVSLAWSGEGLLAATTWSGLLLLIDSRSGEELASAPAHTGSAFGLAFAPDGKTLATAGHDQVLHLWSVPNLEKIATLHGHRDEIWSLAFSSDGRLLSTAGKDGTAKLWTPAPKPAPLYLTNWYAGQFSADGKSFVTLSEPAPDAAAASSNPVTLEFWDVDNPGLRTIKTLPVTDAGLVTRISLSQPARLAAVGKSDDTAEVWSTETGKLVRSGRIQQGHLTKLSFADNGRSLALGSDAGYVEVWNLKTGQVTRFGRPENGRIESVNFSPGSHFLRASTANPRHDLVWDAETGADLAGFPGHYERAEFSPDGRTLAVADGEYVVRLLDLPNLAERAILRGHRWTIYAMAFSPDSRWLATGGGDAVARIWDISTGKEVTRPLRGHLQGITDLAFSPDGKTLATGSTDNTVKMWHLPTGRELMSMPDAARPTFSPDGRIWLLQTSLGTRLFAVPTLAEIDASRHAELVGGR